MTLRELLALGIIGESELVALKYEEDDDFCFPNVFTVDEFEDGALDSRITTIGSMATDIAEDDSALYIYLLST